jgi:hypothetical protein
MRRDVFLQGGRRDKLGMALLVGLSFLAGRLERRPARAAQSGPAASSGEAPPLRPSAAAETEIRLELLEARLVRLEQLGARLEQLEQRQLAVADNLCQANAAFRQWQAAFRLLRRQVQALNAHSAAPPADQALAASGERSQAGR